AATGTLSANSSFNGNSNKNLLVAASSTLAVGASSTITLTLTVTPGTKLGVYENTAVVTANSPSGASVTDQSMDGNDPDPDEDENPSNNAAPTVSTFAETPGLTVTKTAGTVTESPSGTYAVTFTIQVQNSGNVPLRNLQLQDDLRAAFPLPNTISVTAKSVSSAPGSSGIAINSSYNGTSDVNLLNGTGTLNPSESTTISLSISVVSSTGGVFENKALAYGTSPGGFTSMSFDTESVTMDESPVIGLAKNLKSNTPNAGYTQYTLTYELTVKNHGNVTIRDLEIFDDILTEFTGLTPTGFSTAVPSDVNVFSTSYNVLTGNTAWTGSATSNILAPGQELAAGATGTVWITFTVTPGSVTSKTNSATAEGTSPAGTNVTDVSTNGLQTDPDSDGDPSNNSVVTTATFTSPTISGTVYNDNDGLSDSKVDGTGSTAGGLYVNLVNSSGNVVASKAVGASGTYTFTIGDGVVASTTYTVILTNAAQTVGNALSTATLASGWVSTGEDCCDDAGSDGTVDGKVSVTSTGTAVTNVNFGANRIPTATSNSGSFSNPGGTNTVQVPTLAGTDPEDVTLGSGNPMTIVTLPTNGTLYYNSSAVTAGQRIASYDPTKLTFDPNDAITSASFTFKVEDAAGSLSAAATITLNFNTPTITLTGSLTPFVICTGTASTPQTLTVSGSELQADITVSAPTGYEVSLSSGSGYAASITVTKSGTTVSATTIYVRLKSDATNGASGNVSASSTSATTQTVSTGTATVHSQPTTAAAGPDQTQCNNSTFTMAATAATTGTGAWSIVSGSATITTAASATTTVTGVTAGSSVTLRWTITNGTCTSSDDVVLTNHASATVAAAGTDLVNCNNGAFTLAGNSASVGTGVWSVVSGTATITTPSSATSGVTGVTAGTPATLRWTITNGTCTSTDDVVLTNHALPTTAAAGADQTLCNTSTFTMAATAATTGTGAWSIVTGSATITTASSATTTVTGVTAGSSVTLRWTTTNGTCTSTDDVVLTNDAAATVAAAGTDLVNCNNGAFTLAGNSASVGTGVWSLVSGTATITTPSSPTSGVTGVTAGTPATLRWTITNGTCTSSDDVVLTNHALPTTAAAGADQTLCNTST
ncbi:MAG: beta strand repeat-containing protein, partial [bacterium]